MFSNPFSRPDKGIIELSPLGEMELRQKSCLEPNLEPCVAFRFPPFELDRERLKQALRISNEAEESDWTIPDLISTELSRSFNATHSIHSIRDRVGTLAGTALLTSGGFVDSPHELCRAVASRYSMLLQIDLDKAILTRVFENRVKFNLNTDKESLIVNSENEAFSLIINGEALQKCFRPVPFLRVPRFDRAGFRSIVLQSIASLEGVRTEAESTFQTFLSAYEAAYNKWMYGA